MALITLSEIFYMVILTAAVAYIFTGMVPVPGRKIMGFGLIPRKRFNWDEFKFAAIVAAPGIILHELAHKFTAMAYGLTANFFIFKTGLVIAIILKAISSPLIIIAPGFVEISSGATTLQLILIAFAGPGINLAIWILCGYLLGASLNLSKTLMIGLFLTKEINKLLFIFNMLPIPPLDGSKIWIPLFTLLKPLLFG